MTSKEWWGFLKCAMCLSRNVVCTLGATSYNCKDCLAVGKIKDLPSPYMLELRGFLRNEVVCELIGVNLPEPIEHSINLTRYELPYPLTVKQKFDTMSDDMKKVVCLNLQRDRATYLENKLQTHFWQPSSVGVQEYTNGLGFYQYTWVAYEKFIPKDDDATGFK